MKSGTLKKPRKVAIFDIDGTIFRSSLLIEIVEELIEQKLFPVSARAQYEKQKISWLDRNGDYDAYIVGVVGVFMKNIKGISEKDFTRTSKIVVSRYRNRVYLFTRELIKELKKKDYFLLAISNSPKGILDVFCSEFGFDKVYGRLYELSTNKHFTGKIVDEYMIANKANILRRAVRKNNLTLKDSVGVGDTEGDIAFLKLVDNPICFNPNMKLYRHGKRARWSIVVERKDVIYEL
jgi:HAD superfamily hydrolase (TIGR01490 family)